MHTTTRWWVVATVLGSAGCGEADTESRVEPEPEEDAPDHASAFPEDDILRLDITVPSEGWQAMQDDMTDMLGAPGSGGLFGGTAGAEACSGKASGEACTLAVGALRMDGQCLDLPDRGLLCLPSFDGGTDVGPLGDNSNLIPRRPIYVECEVRHGDRMWEHVGLRFKGNSSLATPWFSGVKKLPLRLKFDEYEDPYPETIKQRFHGFQSLSLSNGWGDPSLLRTKVVNDLFVEAGLFAAATAFYRVYVDHGEGPKYFGLYTGSELPSDDAYLETTFGSSEGNLYKPDGVGARFETLDELSLDKQNNEAEADYSDVKALHEALHSDRSDPAAWRARLEATFDVDVFLRWLGLNTVVQDWDTYGVMTHNYYLYADPSREGRLVWIPWDHSESMRPGLGALSLDMQSVTERWPLIRYLLDDPTYAATYRQAVEEAADGVFAPEEAIARFTEWHDRIAPHAVGPDGEQPEYTFSGTEETFTAGLEEIRVHIESRRAAVDAFLTR